MSRFLIASFRSPVALTSSRLADKIDYIGRRRSVIVVPPVITVAGILAGGAVVLGGTLTNFHADRERRRVRGCEDGRVQRSLE